MSAITEPQYRAIRGRCSEPLRLFMARQHPVRLDDEWDVYDLLAACYMLGARDSVTVLDGLGVDLSALEATK